MQKMEAASLADLVRIAERLENTSHPFAPGGRELGVSKRRPVVAVVDDGPRLLESPEDLLESAGDAACSFSPAGSLLVRRLAGVDVLITDSGMLGMDGFELRLLKKVRPELPVFLITGRHELADQYRAQGISGCFRRPFDAQALLAAVANSCVMEKMEGEHET